MALEKKSKGLAIISAQNQITDEEIKDYKRIGKAIGTDMIHCAYLASRHAENFWQRVWVWYFIKEDQDAKMLSEKTGDQYLAIEFYERK